MRLESFKVEDNGLLTPTRGGPVHIRKIMPSVMNRIRERYNVNRGKVGFSIKNNS